MKTQTPIRIAIILIIAAIAVGLSASVLVGSGEAAPLTSLADNVIAYWPLSETSGTRAAVVGGSNLSQQNLPTALGGIIGNAVELNSPSTEYLYTPNTAELTLNDSSYSLSAWFFVTGGSTGQLPIIAKGATATDPEFLLWWVSGGGGTVEWSMYDEMNGTANINTVGNVAASEWHHVVVTYNEPLSQTVLYLDGTAVFTDTVVGTLNTSLDDLTVGYVDYAGGRYFNGLIDEVAIFDASLTAEDVSTIFNNGFGCPYPFTQCENVADAWQFGDYLADGDMELNPTLDGTWWGHWSNWSTQYSSSGLGANYPLLFDAVSLSHYDDLPVCGSYYRRFNGDNIANILGEIPISHGGTSQRFFWYGGEAHLSVAYRTSGTGRAIINLWKPLSADIPAVFDLDKIGMTVQSTSGSMASPGLAWDIYTDTLTLETGWYELELIATTTGANTGGWAVDFDAASISENGFYRCTPNTNILTLPTLPPMPAQRSKLAVPVESVADALYVNDLALRAVDEYGKLLQPNVNTQDFSLDPSTGMINLPVQSGVSALDALRSVKPPVAVAEKIIDTRGTARNAQMLEDLFGTGQSVEPFRGIVPAGQVVVQRAWYQNWFTKNVTAFGVSFVVSDRLNNIISLENIVTGQVYPVGMGVFSEVNEPGFGTDWFKFTGQIDVAPGLYRVNMNSGASETLYLTELCIAPITLGVEVCGATGIPPAEATLMVARQQLTTIAELTGTPAAALTLSAAQVRTAAAGGTQQALVATGNPTLIAQATLAARNGLTATPAAALTRTAAVQVQRFQQTIAAAQTGTAQPYYYSTGTARASGLTATSAIATLQATTIPPLTRTSMARTEQALEPARQTQNAQAALTEMASRNGATATNVAIQKTWVAQSNAQRTAEAIMTANPDTAAVQTAQAQTTQGAQQYQTLVAQLTQSAGQMATAAWSERDVIANRLPPTQPTFSGDSFASCQRPDNAINLPWWIDYSVCRILSWFAPAPRHAQAWIGLTSFAGNREPFGTMMELNRTVTGMKAQLDQYRTATGIAGVGGADTGLFINPDFTWSIYNGQWEYSTSPTALLDYVDACTVTIPGAGDAFIRGVCWGIGFLRYWGFLQWVQMAINFTAFLAFIIYIITWVRRTVNASSSG